MVDDAGVERWRTVLYAYWKDPLDVQEQLLIDVFTALDGYHIDGT